MLNKKSISDSTYLNEKMIESYHLTFYYFINMIEVFSLNTLNKRYFLDTGYSITEFKNDIFNDIEFLLKEDNINLDNNEKEVIINIKEFFSNTPQKIFLSYYIEESDYNYWIYLKCFASVCLISLNNAIEKNRIYYLNNSSL
jgi:hypothetical protein